MEPEGWCRLLAEKRKLVERGELRAWRTRHSCNQLPNKKEKGPVEPGKEKEEEDKLESFFGHLYEFHNPAQVASAFVPAELPGRYVIAFVPASTSFSVPVSVPITASSVSVPDSVTATPAVPATPTVISSVNFTGHRSAPSTDYSAISSVNFAIPVSSPSCIGQTQ